MFITDDILVEILVRLPAPSLARSKCVSKRWLYLISDPDFRRCHFLRNRCPSAIVPSNKPKGNAFPFIPLDDLLRDDLHRGRKSVKITDNRGINNPFRIGRKRDHRNITIAQSCNGLWLLHTGISHQCFTKTKYYVFNPTTNQFSQFNPAKDNLRSFTVMALAFDPSKSPHYNLVKLHEDPQKIELGVMWDTPNFQVGVYSSLSRTWKPVVSSYKWDSQISYDECVYWNGAVHWAGTRDRRLTYYHVDNECFGHVHDYPDNYLKPYTCRSLQESHCGDHLSLVESYSSRVQVSEMGRDYSGWCFKYNVDLIGSMFRDFAVLYVTYSLEDEGDELVLHVPGKIVSCDMRSNEFKSFRLSRMRLVDDSCLRVEQPNFKYVESLADV